MTTRARALVRIWIPLFLVVAGAAPGHAGDPAGVPVFCDDFERADACDWVANPSCAAVCGVAGSCATDLCDCPPLTPYGYLEGHWTGTWEDTVYSKSGAVEATFSIVCGQVVASGTIDLTDISGALGIQAGTGLGTLNGGVLEFTFEAEMVGSGSGTLAPADALADPRGASLGTSNGSGSGSVTAPLSFGAFTFTGTAGLTTISGTFDFTSKTGGAGNVSLTKD